MFVKLLCNISFVTGTKLYKPSYKIIKLTFHLYFVFSKISFYAYSYWRTSAFFFLILMFSLGSFRGAVCLDQTLLLPSSSSISIIGLVSGPCITIPTTEGLSLSSCCSNNPAALANTLSTATLSCSSTSN